MDKILFRIARMKFTGSLIGLALAYLPFIVPVKKIIKNKNVISFFHPVPTYPDHVLIVPRKVARNLFALSSDDFISVVDMAIKIRKDNRQDYTLLINGGDRQDVMQAHFHLFSGNTALKKGLLKEVGNPFLSDQKHFWKQVSDNWEEYLSRNGLTVMSFSVLIQFEADAYPLVYFI